MTYDIDRTYLVWQQVAAAVAHQIAQGRYTTADRLPSVAELAAEFGIATSTADKVMGHLKDARLIRRVKGLGTFLAEGAVPLAKQQPFGPPPRHRRR
ncbi:GntR family transcriptional regulator [Streptomyces sp. VRA16 Mangrove soil]|uniref:GntR family transcriptional regulator n=1 Tax=Streptomyces sp. VRA16 Mangrove soil TaxID=2817434 RepID=UPI001A9CECF4|nr:winged helix-turn-helix domain-containing protein [Streptomyces sp. VRA16 Mangrove soil]MBO1333627.1 winged helix-turn-helix transcriptional regulator [Streptomyces sp. VRA16 Mangrove soil]